MANRKARKEEGIVVELIDFVWLLALGSMYVYSFIFNLLTLGRIR